ncbi:recombinase family protein [Bradyrhizobium sp. cir1]|nr:recombinase family protein [Bradyrhizobium sp. cir1]
MTSAHGIAAALNKRGITAPRGSAWNIAQVSRVLSRPAFVV